MRTEVDICFTIQMLKTQVTVCNVVKQTNEKQALEESWQIAPNTFTAVQVFPSGSNSAC